MIFNIKTVCRIDKRFAKEKTKQIKSSPDDRPKNIADQRSETVKAACLILLIVDQGLMRNN